MNILSSFTVYTAALHALIRILFSLHTSGLGYPGFTVFQQTKAFHLQKQAAGNPTPAASSRRDKNTVLKPLQTFLLVVGGKPRRIASVVGCGGSTHEGEPCPACSKVSVGSKASVAASAPQVLGFPVGVTCLLPVLTSTLHLALHPLPAPPPNPFGLGDHSNVRWDEYPLGSWAHEAEA